MKLFLINLLLFISSLITVAGQTPLSDSIKRILHKTRQDTSRILLMADLANQYQFFNSDSAIIIAQQAIGEAQKMKYLSGEISGLIVLGEIYRNRGDYPQALDKLFTALGKSRNIRDAVGEANSMCFIGIVYMEVSEYRQALNYFLVAAKDSHFFVKYQGRYPFVLSNIGDAYEKLNIADSALFFQRQAHYLAIHIPQSTIASLTSIRMGLLQGQLGNQDSAFEYYRAALLNAYVTGDLLNQGYSQYCIAEWYYDKNKRDSSLYFGRQAFADCQKTHSKRLMEVCALLSKLYRDENRFDSAFQYQAIALAARDSLFGPEKFKKLQLLVFTEQQRQQEFLLSQARAKERLQRFVLMAALTVFLIIALLLWRNIVNRRRAFIQLQKQKTETDLQRTKAEQALKQLKASQMQLVQQEKMASLGELTAGIAHEIQNPLNFVNNFSEINTELIAELEEEADKGNIDEVKIIAKDIKDNEQKIIHHGKRADSIVKGMLQHSRASTGKKELTDINALVDECLQLSYHGMRAKDKEFNAEIKTDFDGSIGKINVVPQDISRVLLNLFNNAFYAVDEKKRHQNGTYEPAVSVCTKKLDGKVEIHVKDNGNGIPQNIVDKIFQPFFTTKPTGQGTGLGLSLSYDIIKAHGGEIKVESKEGEGSAFMVKIPLS